uniref:hydroxyisourate hydrolase n=1 Tax=Pantoea sp. IMH TaxID=1267600 RepID=UPI000468F7BC|nr:hydroxyisourate hydrolase [Pantoea sp. IMH]
MHFTRKTLLATLVLASFTTGAAVAAEAKNPLSVHVLNLQTGVPTAGVAVELEQYKDQKWVKLASGTTDSNGRITALFPSGKTMSAGDYKVVFKTGDYYDSVKQPSFFPEIPVIFHAEDKGGHYHIPLLLSQYGYSTYRGN